MGPVAAAIDKMIAKKVAAQIIAALGVASIPVLGHVLVIILTSWADFAILWLLGKTIIGGARIFVIQNVDWEVSDVEAAKTQLQEILDNPEKYTAEQMAQIEKDFDQAADKLIHITNAKMPV
jgi:hypothetical protein